MCRLQERTDAFAERMRRYAESAVKDLCEISGGAEPDRGSNLRYGQRRMRKQPLGVPQPELFDVRAGDFLLYESATPFPLHGVRLVFDSDLNRNYHNMPCCIRLHEERYTLPKTLLRDFDLLLTDEHGQTETYPYRDVHCRLLTLPFTGNYTAVRFVPRATYGSTDFRVFSFEIL